MNLVVRSIFIISLVLCYKYIPTFEPKGINYLISLICLGFIGFELKKVWDSIKLNEKIKIQKIAYFTVIICIFLSVILIMHKEFPAGNIRYIRGILIVMCIGIGGKIVGIISKSTINNFTKNSVLFTFSAISFIAILEITFMFISLSHGSGEAFSGKIWGKRNWNPINSLGLRDEEPKEGKNTVFFVGDSFTAGWGVKKIEERFGEITAEELKKKGKIINEINLGRYGADTQLEFHLMETFIKKTNITPDHIVLQFFVNDMDNLMPVSKNCTQKPVCIPSWKKTVIEGSYLINFINSIYPSSNNNVTLPKECDYAERLKNAFNTDSIWEKEEHQLLKFINYCKEKKIKMTIVFFPFMEDLELAKNCGIENKINVFANKNNLHFFNVGNYINTLSTKEREASTMDAHASAKVHRIVGKKLATQIQL